MAKNSNKEQVFAGVTNTQGKDTRLYELLRKIAEDLYSTYETVYDGPIVIDIGIDEINGIIDTSNLPSTVAYTNVANVFIEDQTLIKNEGQVKVGVVGPTSYMRMQAIANNDFLLGGNLIYTGGALVNESGGGSGIRLQNGHVRIITGVTIRMQALSTGVITIGNSSVVGANAGDATYENNRGPRGTNGANNATFSMSKLDANDVVQLGDSTVGRAGCVGIPKMTNANLPTAGSTENGIIAIDTTNNRLCYYSGGNRYYLTGTAF